LPGPWRATVQSRVALFANRQLFGRRAGDLHAEVDEDFAAIDFIAAIQVLRSGHHVAFLSSSGIIRIPIIGFVSWRTCGITAFTVTDIITHNSTHNKQK